jgi:hypothetical protein
MTPMLIFIVSEFWDVEDSERWITSEVNSHSRNMLYVMSPVNSYDICEFAADSVEKTSASEERVFERQRSHQNIRERTHQSETALTSSSCQSCGVR